jgi:hypothetical protein
MKILKIKICIAILIVFCTLLSAQTSYPKFTFPLKISNDNRKLIDQNGIPFLINGDTAWSLIVTLNKEETEIYLENRRLKGFNSIIVELIENYFGGPTNAYNKQPFTNNGDFSNPNEAYFAHADWIIKKAEEKNILVFLTPAYLGFGCGEQGWCQELVENGVDKCREYGQFLGKRYKDFSNIVWMHGGDAEAGYAKEEVNAIIEGIKEYDKEHLHTAHCYRQQSAIDCFDEDWLDINNTYSDCFLSANKTYKDYVRQNTKPFFYSEGRYEGEGASNVCLRSQAYWSILGGSTGHFLGNNPIWLFRDDIFLSWKDQLETIGAQSMQYMYNLFNSRHWYNLVPDYEHRLVTIGYGNVNDESYVAAARTTDSTSAIIYMPQGKNITIDLTKMAGDSTKAWWYEPSSGIPSFISTFSNHISVQLTSPDNGDWVLVLDDASIKLLPPGDFKVSTPVELESFKAEYKYNKISLTWITTSETNNYGFEIQKSIGSVYQTIGFVPGYGTNSARHEYLFEDFEFSVGCSKYRLKKIDFDGSNSFSPVVEVTIQPPQKFTLYQNYPNPFNSRTSITFNVKESGKFKLNILNLKGQELIVLLHDFLFPGQYTKKWNASNFSSGVYILRFENNGYFLQKKLLLLN